MHVPSCNNAGVYLTSYTDARTSLTYSCYIIGYPWPTYIRWRVIYYLPLTQSLKNCISIAGLIQYAALALAADAHVQKEDLGKKKKHVISRYRTCDFLTWSQQLFWLDHANILPLIRARSPTDTNKQASIRTENSPPNSLVWGSLRLAPTIPWTGPGFWTGLDSGLDSWKDVFLVPLLCQRGQGANAMPPGSQITESRTLILVIVPPTKCTCCMGEDNTYLDGRCRCFSISIAWCYCRNWKDKNVTTNSLR